MPTIDTGLLVTLMILAPLAGGLVAWALPGRASNAVAICTALATAIFAGLVALHPFRLALAATSWAGRPEIWATAGLVMTAYIGWWALRRRRPLVVGLAVLQIAAVLAYELTSHASEVFNAPTLVGDRLAYILMLLASGIGFLVVLYTTEYMPTHALRHHVPARAGRFFAVMLGFIGAMNGLALANDLRLLHLFWEATTLCSFLLIGHDRTPEAETAAARAAAFNLGGGLLFTLALIFLRQAGVEPFLSALAPAVVRLTPALSQTLLLATACLVVAGLIKAAQFPFSGWLLGAMVAPAPVSALLHSATMVKAGVYLILRLSPVLTQGHLGWIVALLGAFTAAVASAAALTQRHAKRVLAYSTVANLGLMIGAAGLGTPAAMAAGLILMAFHALSKGLLFLAVGSAEEAVGSLDLEAMEGLYSRAPMTTVAMAVGVLSMLLPPFGVLVGKWVTLEAAAHSPLVLALTVASSALTVAFWARWLGPMLTRPSNPEATEPTGTERLTLGLLAVTVLFFSLLLGPIAAALGLRGRALVGAQSPLGLTGPWGTWVVLGLAALFPLPWLLRRSTMVRSPYLCGENVGPQHDRFSTVGDQPDRARVEGYYLRGLVSEGAIVLVGSVGAVALILVLGGAVFS